VNIFIFIDQIDVFTPLTVPAIFSNIRRSTRLTAVMSLAGIRHTLTLRADARAGRCA